MTNVGLGLRRVPWAILYSVGLTLLFPSWAAGQAYGYRFYRTDVDPANVIYDPAHQQFFVSVAAKNEILAISGNDGSLLAQIDVPTPNALDLSPDGSLLFASGSSSSSLPPYAVIDGFFAIDTTTFRVVRLVQSVLPLIDLVFGDQRPRFGSLAAMRSGKLFYNVDSSIFEYDPQTGASVSPPAGVSGYIRKSANGARFVATGAGLQVYDASTDQFTAAVPLPKDRIPPEAASAIFNPDGTRILVNGHLVTDQHFNQIVDLWPDMEFLNHYGSTFSPDGSKVYCFGQAEIAVTNPIVRVFDAATGSILGDVSAPGPGRSLFAGIAVSSKGLALLIGDRGVAVLDVSTPVQTLGRYRLGMNQITPRVGQAQSPAPVVFGLLPNSPTVVGDFTFGTSLGSVLQNGHDTLGEPAVTVQPPPAAVPGAVNLSAQAADGSAFYGPDGYSYGPVIVFQDIGAGPSEGGTKVHLIGYGFDSSVPPVVTVGGAAATVTTVSLFPGISPFPFPIQHLEFLIPQGVIGPADITLTTSNGTTTKKNGYVYLPHSQLPGLQPVQMALDERRGRLYVADGASGDVKAVDTNTLAVSTLVPMAAGAATGLAITPDGGRLLVISQKAGTLTVFDLNAGVIRRSFFPTPDGQPAVSWCPGCPPAPVTPTAVAGTARGTALVGLAFPSLEDTGKLYEVDLQTGAAVDLNAVGAIGVGDVGWQMLLAPSADGSEVYIASSGLYGTDGGYLSLWSSGLGAVAWRRFYTSSYGFLNLSASGYGDRVVADSRDAGCRSCRNSFTFSRRLDELTVLAPNELLTTMRSPVLGEKMNSGGSLLYVPTTKGVEIYDIYRGDLRLSVGIPGGVQAVADGIVIDSSGSTLYVSESGALGVIQLPAAPLSIGSVEFNGVTPGTRGRGGDKVSIKGSGFQKGATLTIGSTVARTDVLSSTEATATAPVLPRRRNHSDTPPPFGITEQLTVAITNPDGDTYRLPASYDPNQYLTEPVPVLTAIGAPAVASGSFAVTIKGSGFLATSEVYIDGVSVQTAFLDSQHLVMYLFEPPAGRHSVAVLNPHAGTSNIISTNFQ